MIIDGRALAKEILARTRVRARSLARRPYVVALVAIGATPATRSYLSIKARSAEEAGCDFYAATNPGAFFNADAALIQLPLPEGMDIKEVCDTIPVEKDADVLSSRAREKFEKGEEGALLPPVVGAVHEIFERHGVEVRGKKCVVVGSGFLVGAPAAAWLKAQGGEVTVVTSKTGDLSAVLRTADIIISGAGSPHFIKPEMLKSGVVLVDAGTSESGGAIAGDADPSCADVCSIFTPVPGGMGPLAVAKLFENAVTLAERKNS
jgi:methylenetetrahydrofolate dehydrogenase (NADP+)/methenyltetrahydrofolate cyclohydrolase